MALFLSTYINRVDSKGRVSVPAPFRALLVAQAFQGVVLCRAHAYSCLEGFGWDTMAELGARLDEFDFFSAAQDDLATSIFGEAVQLPFDGEGRVVLPEELRSYAQIEQSAAFVGMGRKFQIWQPEAFAQRRQQAREGVREKGLTLPKAHGAGRAAGGGS